MSMIISIETSSSDYEIALGLDREVIYSSADHEGLNATKDLGLLLRTGLKETGQSIAETSLITVNIGPGGLGAVRSGVSFANGLSFGLGKPLLPLNSFELVGFQASQSNTSPVLITSNAADGHAYGGLYKDGSVIEYHYGKLADTAQKLAQSDDDIILAGTHQEELPQLLTDATCEKSGIKFAAARTHIQYVAAHDVDARLSHEPATALNELSHIFNGSR